MAGPGMKAAKQLQQGQGAFELIEQAFHLLRLAPASILAGYYLGTAPFVLCALFFWSDMSRSAFAEQRLAGGALGLALLFFWMKTWQAIFAPAKRLRALYFFESRLCFARHPNFAEYALWRGNLF